MPILANMNLLLANESDCRLFKFWFHDRVCDGISYQGELFYQFHSFSTQRREQAYDLGSKLIDRGISVIICCSKQRYLLGINLRNNWSATPEGSALLRGEHEKQQFLIEVQGLESVLSQLLQ
ncbi:hypothetical protein ACQ4M3_21180 [Leptolyngbya sp. AN03gr2]|uniref:hypothetical protein n=1 Tax=unclassified Leptolyngbya TaxID=2650499 RepID=UPI003D311B5D